MSLLPSDFDPPSADVSDRVLALRAVIDAKGQTLPTPDVCHGYENCCQCPACQWRYLPIALAIYLYYRHRNRRLKAA